MEKIFLRTLTAFIVASLFLISTVVHAEIKIYDGEGTYVMSEGENLGVAKERAKVDAMRNACEKAGTYVKSYSRTKNFELDEDVIETMTSNILKLVEEPHFYPPETVDNLEGLLIRVTVKAQIDDAEITKWLNKDSQEISTLVSQNESLRKSNEELARQNEELKRQLAQASTQHEKDRIAQEFADEDKKFLSNQKVEEGLKLWSQGDFNGAKNLFEEAIQLNPDNADALLGRGTVYLIHQQYDQAIQDYDRAAELNPNNIYVYYNRGLAYVYQRQYERAIQDYDKAIQLNPNYLEAYYNRGLTYAWLGNYNQALADAKKAIQLNPNFALAYQLRDACYQALGYSG